MTDKGDGNVNVCEFGGKKYNVGERVCNPETNRLQECLSDGSWKPLKETCTPDDDAS